MGARRKAPLTPGSTSTASVTRSRCTWPKRFALRLSLIFPIYRKREEPPFETLHVFDIYANGINLRAYPVRIGYKNRI